YQLAQSDCSIHRNADPVVLLVFVGRADNPPLALQQFEEPNLAGLIELLSVQVHRVSRSAPIIHEPHRKCELCQLHLWSSFEAHSIEELVIRPQTRDASS